MKEKLTSEQLVEKCQTAYNTNNMLKAYRYWCRLFNKNKSSLDLFKYTDMFKDEEVYGICDYGRDKEYKKMGYRGYR